MLKGMLPGGLNLLEVLLALLILVITTVALWQQSQRKGVIWGLLVLGPVLFLTVAETTQFMTMDEYGISLQLSNPLDRASSQLLNGAFHTGILVALPVVRLGEAAGVSVPVIRMALKALWWLIGTGLLLIVVDQLRRACALRPNPRFLVPAMALTLLLPTNQLAIKIFNYDIFSLSLAFLAILLTVRTICEKRRSLSWGAVAVAALAAQEKLNASPILLAIIIVLAAWTARCAVRPTLASIRFTVTAVTLTLAISAASLLSFSAFTRVSWDLMATVADPLISWMWVPARFFLNDRNFLVHRGMMVGLAAISILLATVVAGHIAVRCRSFRPHLIACSAMALPFLYILGAGAGLAYVHPFWSPFHPVKAAALSSLPLFNGISLHFDAESLVGHYGRFILYICVLFVVSLPTSVGLLWATTAWKQIRDPSAPRPPIWFDALFCLALMMPFMAVPANVPVAHRYLNIWIALATALVIARAAIVWNAAATGRRGISIAAATLVIFAAVETSPFAPLFAAFRPFWLDYGDAQKAEPGRLNPSWMGWGEEIMLAGKQIEHRCTAGAAPQPCDDITLVTLDPGLWLPGPRTLHLLDWNAVRNAPPLNSTTYYVVNRSTLIQNFYPIPSIEPDFTVSFRGYAQGWVWRGDRLAASGYHFTP